MTADGALATNPFMPQLRISEEAHRAIKIHAAKTGLALPDALDDLLGVGGEDGSDEDE